MVLKQLVVYHHATTIARKAKAKPTWMQLDVYGVAHAVLGATTLPFSGIPASIYQHQRQLKGALA